MPVVNIVPMPGVPGPQGPRGLQGIQGEVGLTGPIGPSGSSAYEVAVANGFVGTEEEWLNSLVGEQGPQGEPGPVFEPIELDFAVNGGATISQPTFNGAPLFTGSYVRIGNLVHFEIQVDMDNITNFGSGQYYVDLPFNAKYSYQMREGCLHDISSAKQYSVGGHVQALSNRLYLNYTDSNGRDAEFTSVNPATLSTQDNFHISGTYIAVNES